MKVRLTVEKETGRVLGAQIVGDYTASVDKRLDVFATAIKAGMTASDLTSLDLSYAPPFSEALDLPIVAGNLAEAKVLGKECSCNAEGLED
jgi:pyruvate/2-oxoglutarate dehydrogenase complex dihydrolipoamide dehydrogenase (E3) component